jgi:hypothetical protein
MEDEIGGRLRHKDVKSNTLELLTVLSIKSSPWAGAWAHSPLEGVRCFAKRQVEVDLELPDLFVL